ncbi:MAG: hypothetical protein JXP73_14315 [Deltaproteobacteria bacterium]|nr:hypothetical protein [Deltaproteobacteria bacterium]
MAYLPARRCLAIAAAAAALARPWQSAATDQTAAERAQQVASAAGSWRALDLPASLARLLDTGRWDGTPVNFRIIVLSFLADGCVAQARANPSLRDAASACVARCIKLSQKTRPPSLSIARADEGLWLSHSNLMLGAYDSLGACQDPALHAKIARALARRSLREPTFHAPSYANKRYRWAADQAATLASLARYDRGHGAHLAAEPLARWRDTVLAKAMDETLGLPWSEFTGRARGAREPRGSALAWQTRFLCEVDPALASQWWHRFKAHYLVDGLAGVGFREWPPGRDRAADADSGPIVAGVGAAATALAIAAARVMGERPLAARLLATASLVERSAQSGSAMARANDTVLASAILYLGRHIAPASCQHAGPGK